MSIQQIQRSDDKLVAFNENPFEVRFVTNTCDFLRPYNVSHEDLAKVTPYILNKTWETGFPFMDEATRDWPSFKSTVSTSVPMSKTLEEILDGVRDLDEDVDKTHYIAEQIFSLQRNVEELIKSVFSDKLRRHTASLYFVALSSFAKGTLRPSNKVIAPFRCFLTKLDHIHRSLKKEEEGVVKIQKAYRLWVWRRTNIFDPHSRFGRLNLLIKANAATIQDL